MSAAEPAPPGAAGARLAAIDLLKGLAALWVLLIHADALAGEPAMVYVFNRAAQIFVVLMGLNAELWWRKRDSRALGEWYRGRFWRLYPQMWAAVAVWWVVASLAKPEAHVALGWSLLARYAAGYLAGIGTGWFVSLAIAVAIFFPILHFAARRLGAATLLAIGVASTCVTVAYRFELMSMGGQFGYYAFLPRLLAHVTFGLALAPIAARLGWRAGLAAAAVCAVYFAAPLLLGEASPWQLPPDVNLGASTATACAQRLMDLPVSLLLLLGCAAIAGVPLLARPLTYLGNESYGIYLGQMVTHNAIGMLVGFEALRRAIGPLGYAGVLLVGALVWVAAVEGTRRLRRWASTRYLGDVSLARGGTASPRDARNRA